MLSAMRTLGVRMGARALTPARPSGIGARALFSGAPNEQVVAQLQEELKSMVKMAHKDLKQLHKEKAHLNAEIGEIERFLETEAAGLDFTVPEDLDLDTPRDESGDMEIDPEKYLDILPAGHSILKEVASPVDASQFKSEPLKSLVDKMVYTMRMRNGVGLAAPQVGASMRIVVVEHNDLDDTPRPELAEEYEKTMTEEDYPSLFPLTVLINPVVTPTADSKEAVYYESCLSIEGFHALVPRPNAVDVEAFDVDGNPQKFTAKGWMARVIQHEFDHLNGILFPERMIASSFSADEAPFLEDMGDEDDEENSIEEVA